MLKLDRVYAGHRFNPVTGVISTQILPGEKLIVSGCAKCGKTTFLETAAGIIPPVWGCVYFDRMPITEYSKKELLKKLCYIPQDLLPGEKARRILNALESGFEYIFADEPFAFMSACGQYELLNAMNSYPQCSIIITETAPNPVYYEGFSTLHLTSNIQKTAFSEENAVYMH